MLILQIAVVLLRDNVNHDDYFPFHSGPVKTHVADIVNEGLIFVYIGSVCT